jgi:hypothetical protein
MKNIKYILPLLLLFSCKKETTINKSNACKCYEIHENMDYKYAGSSLVKTWVFAYKTTPQPDLCDKATGEYVYSGNVNQFRYIVKCN